MAEIDYDQRRIEYEQRVAKLSTKTLWEDLEEFIGQTGAGGFDAWPHFLEAKRRAEVAEKRIAELEAKPVVAITADDERTIKALRQCVAHWVDSWYIGPDGGQAKIKDDGPVGQMLKRLEEACEKAKVS
jgi:hypothetical protein